MIIRVKNRHLILLTLLIFAFSNYGPIVANAMPQKSSSSKASSLDLFKEEFKKLENDTKISITKLFSSDSSTDLDLLLESEEKSPKLKILLSNFNDKVTTESLSNYSIETGTLSDNVLTLKVPNTTHSSIYTPKLTFYNTYDNLKAIVIKDGDTFKEFSSKEGFVKGSNYTLEGLDLSKAKTLECIFIFNDDSKVTQHVSIAFANAKLPFEIAKTSTIQKEGTDYYLNLDMNNNHGAYNRARLFIEGESYLLPTSALNQNTSNKLKLNLNKLDQKPNLGSTNLTFKAFTVDKYGYIYCEDIKTNYDTVAPKVSIKSARFDGSNVSLGQFNDDTLFGSNLKPAIVIDDPNDIDYFINNINEIISKITLENVSDLKDKIEYRKIDEKLAIILDLDTGSYNLNVGILTDKTLNTSEKEVFGIINVFKGFPNEIGNPTVNRLDGKDTISVEPLNLNTIKNYSTPDNPIPDNTILYPFTFGDSSTDLEITFKLPEIPAKYNKAVKVRNTNGALVNLPLKIIEDGLNYTVKISKKDCLKNNLKNFTLDLILELNSTEQIYRSFFSFDNTAPEILGLVNNTKKTSSGMDILPLDKNNKTISFNINEESFSDYVNVNLANTEDVASLANLSVNISKFTYKETSSSKESNVDFTLSRGKNGVFELTHNNKFQKGFYSLTIVAKDLVGNTTTKEFTFLMDYFENLIEPISTDNFKFSKDSTSFLGNIGSNNIVDFQFKLAPTVVSYDSFTVTINSNGNEHGSVTVPVSDLDVQTAKIPIDNLDSLGDVTLSVTLNPTDLSIVNPSETFNFKFDNAAPKLEISSNTTSGVSDDIVYFNDTNVTLNILATDSEGNLNLTQDSINNSALNINSLYIESFKNVTTNTSVDGSLSLIDGINCSLTPLNLLDNNKYTLVLVSYDMAGNKSSFTYTFVIDKTHASLDTSFTVSTNTTMASLNIVEDFYYTNSFYKDDVLPLRLAFTSNSIETNSSSFAPTEIILEASSKANSSIKVQHSINVIDKNATIDFNLPYDMENPDNNIITLNVIIKKANGTSTSKGITFICDKTVPSIDSILKNDENENSIDENSLFSYNGFFNVNITDSNFILSAFAEKGANSVSLTGLKVETLSNDETDITDAYGFKLIDGQITLCSGNEPALLPDGRYSMKFVSTDLALNSYESTLNFVIDSKEIKLTSKITYKDINENTVTKNIDLLNERLYIPFNASLDFNIEGNISYFESSYLAIKDMNGNNCTDKIITPVSSVIDSEGNISKDKNSKVFSFNLQNEDDYTLSLFLKANNGKVYEKTFYVTVDTTDPLIDLTMNGSTGSKDNVLYTNKTNHFIDYAVKDTNFDKLTHLSHSSNSELSSPNGKISSSINSEGKYTVTVSAKDKAGRSASKTLDLIVDRTAPEITLPSHSYNTVNGIDYTNKVQPFNYSVSEENVDVTDSMLVNGVPTSKTFPILGDGTKNISISAKDIAGNTSSETFNYVLDTIAPSITYENVEIGKHYNKPVSALFNAADSNFDKEDLEVLLNGNPYDYETITADGNYNFGASVTDYAGNTTNLSVPFVIDTVAPMITISGIIADALNSGILKPTIKIDDLTANLVLLLNGDAYFGGPIIGNGKMTLIAMAMDKAGNLAKTILTFMLDSYGPEIFIEGVEDGRTYTSSIIPKVWSEKNSIIEILLNGKKYNNEPITEPGVYTLEIVATDKANNITKKKVTFEIVSETLAANKSPLTNSGSNNTTSSSLVIFLVCIGLISIAFLFILLRKSKKAK